MAVKFKKIESPGITPEIRGKWKALLSGSPNLYKMYQSPHWWEHLLQKGDSSNYDLIMVEDSEGTLKGIIPLKKSVISLNVTFKRRELKTSSFNCLEVLGSQLILPVSSKLYSDFLQWVWKHYRDVDGVYFKSLPTDSPEWHFMEERHWKIDGCLVYKLSSERDFYILKSPATFDKYLETQFKKKKRYNLKRQVRMLEEATKKKINVECITDPELVPVFNNHVKTISERSWKAKKLENYIPAYVQDNSNLVDVASKQLLRAYLLYADGEPITYVLGYQYEDVYHYSDIGFDENFAKYSPGSVLLFRLIEDLVNNTKLKYINFGIGDSEYKRQFATDRLSDNSLIVLRNTFRNRLHFHMNEILKKTKEKLRALVK